MSEEAKPLMQQNVTFDYNLHDRKNNSVSSRAT